MAQLLATAYQMTQRVDLTASGSTLPRTVGLRGEYECALCSEGMRVERGLCPYVEGAEKATSPCVIDSTGDEAHDYLWRCPQGLLLEEPALQASLSQYAQIEALGGAAAYYGAQQGLGTLPARVTRTLQYLSAIKSRFERDVSRTQQEMLSQRTKPAMGRA